MSNNHNSSSGIEQFLDISKHPMEVAPTAHYSMGGILVNPDEHSTFIKGLFAAGELVGGLFYHNYPGGSGLMAGAVFGKISGASAARNALGT